MERCEQCRRAMSDDWFEFRCDYGPDYGESHFFCDECLALLEIGQGLCEDPLFAAEWKQMIAEAKEAEGEFYQPGYAERDASRATRMYQRAGRTN